jgi:hypothetical protein
VVCDAQVGVGEDVRDNVVKVAGGDCRRWGREERRAVLEVVGVSEEAVELEREEVDMEQTSGVDDGAPLLTDAA